MTKAFRSLCMIFAVLISAFSLTACSLFNKDDDDDGGDDDIEIVLSDESDPFVLRVGESITVSVLSPIGDPSWESLDTKVATVTNNGVITGVSQGSTVLAVMVGEYFDTRNVTVMPALQEEDPPSPPVGEKETVTLNQTEVTVQAGETTLLTAVSSKGSKISWESLDTLVATVNNGIVTGINVGTTAVIARSSTGAATSCLVTVTHRPTPETITLNRETISVYAGDTATLTAHTSKGSSVSWSSSDTAVATVSNGKITAKKVGSATITASISNGAKATCTVEVLKAPDSGFVPNKDGYTLTWNDEFDGSSLDTNKWGYQTGIRDVYNGVWSEAWFWGNDELQYYTDASKNVSVSNGHLNITAIKEDMADGRSYSSARIITRDKFSQTYGYFEARMKTPTGNGMWPAFWMLPQPDGSYGSNNDRGGWPHSGEIDIMEAKGRLNNKTDHTIHFSNKSGGHQYLGKAEYALSSNTDEWHTYAVDWTPEYIRWYVDGEPIWHYLNSAWTTQTSDDPAAPFDRPFYVLLNLAVGGQYDGYVEPDKNSFVSATMQVDYVRVWQNNQYL